MSRQLEWHAGESPRIQKLLSAEGPVLLEKKAKFFDILRHLRNFCNKLGANEAKIEHITREAGLSRDIKVVLRALERLEKRAAEWNKLRQDEFGNFTWEPLNADSPAREYALLEGEIEGLHDLYQLAVDTLEKTRAIRDKLVNFRTVNPNPSLEERVRRHLESGNQSPKAPDSDD